MIRLQVVEDEAPIRNGIIRHVPFAELGVDEVRSASSAEEALKQPAVAIISLENGEKKEHLDTRTAVDCRMLRFELIVSGRESYFKWGYEGEDTKPIGPVFATDKLSDEYCKYGEFTGTMVGIFAVDSMFHKKEADFDYFSITNKEE